MGSNPVRDIGILPMMIWSQGGTPVPQLASLRSLSATRQSQSVQNSMRLTALCPCLTAGLPLSVQSL